MNDEIKTEDIIKSLRACARFDACKKCIFVNEDARCTHSLMEEAADMMERLSNQHIKIQYNSEELTVSEMCSRMDRMREKLNAARMENELLRGALASCNVPENAGAEHFPDAAKMMLDGESIMRQAIETYGVQAQCDVAIEEMAELTKAIMKIRRVANDYEKTQSALDNLLEEIADVDIMIDQLKIMWGPKQVEEYRRKKLERLERRLEGDRNET